MRQTYRVGEFEIFGFPPIFWYIVVLSVSYKLALLLWGFLLSFEIVYGHFFQMPSYTFQFVGSPFIVEVSPILGFLYLN